MNKAILEAKKAVLFDEVPIGAVIVNNDTEEIIALNHNRINKKHDATQHAEILVIQESCNKLESKYLMTDDAESMIDFFRKYKVKIIL